MIINKRNVLNIHQIENSIDHIEDNFQLKPGQELLLKIQDFTKLNQTYEAALNEVATKLENLNAEFQVNFQHNPIHHMEGRLKSVQSILGKLTKQDHEISIDSIKANIHDYAGIRVITNYIEDIYTIEKLLTSQDDIKLIKRKDYINRPKENGYRSLHLVISVPVFFSRGTEHTLVEIQIRTIGMDMWASLEHKLRYKTRDLEKTEKFKVDLKSYATELHNIELDLQEIHIQLK